MKKDFLLAIFECEEALLKGAEKARDKKMAIYDCYTPFPVHGLDDLMGIKRSILPYVTFLAGATGLAMAIGFQIWASAVDWPTIIGGKPFISLPAFIPITFEFTVLLGAHTTVAAFLALNKLYPGKKPVIMDENQTDYTFVLAVEKENADASEFENLMKEQGAVTVRQQNVEMNP